MGDRRLWEGILKMLKENVYQPRVLYIVKLSFKNEGCKIGLHFILLHMVVQFS